MARKIEKTDEEWKQLLTEDEYVVCRQKGTERPFSGEYNDTKEDGVFRCRCCGEPLFNSTEKFDSGSGWPSFYKPATESGIEESMDSSHGMTRIEIQCSACGSHLGHVFTDGPQPTGLRYCVNSLSLKLDREES
jgi:peptide-methionine (R)-S-oxide reductase